MKTQNINTNSTKTSTSTPDATKRTGNHQCSALPVIAFDKSGYVIAGQEYLEAIVKSGKSAEVKVVMGCESVADLMSELGAFSMMA
jgi:hypothetical protein